MKLSPSDILGTIVNFFILYFILRHFLFAKVNNALDERENFIETKIKNTKENEEKALAFRMETENKLKESKNEGKSIVEDYKVKAQKISDDLLKEANEEAQLIIERAKTEVQREKEKAIDEIKHKSVDVAILLSSKALEKSIDENEHRRLIEDFISKVGI